MRPLQVPWLSSAGLKNFEIYDLRLGLALVFESLLLSAAVGGLVILSPSLFYHEGIEVNEVLFIYFFLHVLHVLHGLIAFRKRRDFSFAAADI